jgi:DNA-binding beta-propeller fold protein YncE
MDTTGVVYDPVHKLVFAAVQQMNTVQVFAPSTGQTVASIAIPSPRQLDISADGSHVLVGTTTNYLYWVDPVKLQVMGTVPAASPLFPGLMDKPLRPVTLAGGKVLVGMGDFPPREWDPATNTWSNPTPSGFDAGQDVIRRSGDHSKAIVASLNGDTVAIFDAASDSYGPVQNMELTAAALNSDGTRIAVLGRSPTIPGGMQVRLFDQDFKVLASYDLTADAAGTPTLDDVLFSRDDGTVFVEASNYVTALNAKDLSFLGQTASPGLGSAEYPSDIDETNMIFSPWTQRATTFTDASSPCALGTNEPVNVTLTPHQGSKSAPGAVTLYAASGITAETQVYFGAPPGSPDVTPGVNVTPNPPASLTVTPPAAANDGAVNVTVTNPDGSLAIAVDGFSYGSSVLSVATNSGPAAGGTSVTVYGYGMAFDAGQISVTVGGNGATVTSAFAGSPLSGFPFPLDQVTFTTPAGNPGAADIVLKTPVGTATVKDGFHYLAKAKSFAASGGLTEAVYDRSRKRLYAADGGSNAVVVFDATQQQFLSSITVGNAPQALAITPDLNTLVVSNGADASISIVDLTGLNPVRTVQVGNLPDLPAQCGQILPFGVVTTSKNQAVIALSCSGLTAGRLIVLDLATRTIGCGTSAGCAAMLAAFPDEADQNVTMSGTPDGSSVLLWNGAGIGRWDVNADTFTAQRFGLNLLPSPVVQTASAGDATDFALVYGIFDPNLYQFSLMQDVDYLHSGVNSTDSLPGEKLDASGGLLYFPEGTGFSIYDVHQGHIKRRVALQDPPAMTFDAMAIDDTGSQVFLLTAKGLTMIDIGDVPLSIGHVQPASGPTSGGATVLVRGSGFQSGAKVLFDKTQAATEFVDASTLRVASPAITAGGVRITVVNPDGSQYSLDNGFTAQ